MYDLDTAKRSVRTLSESELVDFRRWLTEFDAPTHAVVFDNGVPTARLDGEAQRLLDEFCARAAVDQSAAR